LHTFWQLLFTRVKIFFTKPALELYLTGQTQIVLLAVYRK